MSIKNIISGFCLLVFTIGCQEEQVSDSIIYVCTPTELLSNNHPKADQFQMILDQTTEALPGIQFSVLQNDTLSFHGSSGMADIPNNVALMSCTKTMVGSISKIFTAVLIMQAVEEKIVDINDLMQDHLPLSLIEGITNYDQITVRQLLNHSSGIEDYLGANYHIQSLNVPNRKLTQEEKIHLIDGKDERFPPGEKYEYSNTNYVLLGLMIEEIRNQNLWDVVDQYIIEPIGLQNTMMGTHDTPLPEGTARPYVATGNSKFMDIYQYSVSDAATGDGGIASCTQDLIIFMKALVNGELISIRTYEDMMQDRIVIEAEEEWYGLGLEMVNSPEGSIVGHTGSTSSYNAILYYYPKRETFISVALNGVAESGEALEVLQSTWGNLIDTTFD